MESMNRQLNQIITHYEKKDYQSAEKLTDELIAAHPEFHRGQFLKAIILEETGRPEEAEKHYAKAGNRFTLLSRLALQLHTIDPERAIIYYEQVTKMDPQNNLLWFNLGSLYEKLGRPGQARDCFRHLAPVREVLSRIFIPLGFMIFLGSGAILMLQRGEKGLAVVVIASAVFCVFWLKRDAGKAIKMIGKKMKAK
jgi:tetratricopeptide (TPR) repeat protein